jgi:ubiquinone/menaquinone biosynthesis C-methylase UbiE
MSYKNLLISLPSVKRSILRRKKKKFNSIKIAKKFGKEYFDGARSSGYGGYYYDGRWKTVASDIINFFKLKKNDKVLDVGCAKGFLVKDLLDQGIDAFGIDISNYAIKNCHPQVLGRISYGNAKNLLFQNNSFDAVISINCIHNLKAKECEAAIKEIERVSKSNKSFIQVDSYQDTREKKLFLDWALTAKTHYYPDKWIEIFKKCGYTGYWSWTILKPNEQK